MGRNRHAVWGQGGDDYPLYDKLKIFMVRKSVQRYIPKHLTQGTANILDVGCGYDARLLHQLYDDMEAGVGVDFEVSDQIKKDPKFSFFEGDLYESMPKIPSESFDLIIFLSILEHLEDPVTVLTEARRLLKTGGRIFFNSPNWFGKWVLENVLSNKIFDPYGETPKQYNSHKMYYSPRDMWPILVKAGFVSTEIKIWRSNFLCSISGYAEKNSLDNS